MYRVYGHEQQKQTKQFSEVQIVPDLQGNLKHLRIWFPCLASVGSMTVYSPKEAEGGRDS